MLLIAIAGAFFGTAASLPIFKFAFPAAQFDSTLVDYAVTFAAFFGMLVGISFFGVLGILVAFSSAIGMYLSPTVCEFIEK